MRDRRHTPSLTPTRQGREDSGAPRAHRGGEREGTPLAPRRGRVVAAVKRPLVLGAVLLLAMFLAGCANGTYPVDIFYEMHYQQSYQVHEPPRISVPAGAVPITGRQLAATENPIPGQRVEEGARLYAANCAFCHGATGKGDDPELQGPVLRIMREKYGYGTEARPYAITPDLTSETVVALPDVGVFAWITNGVVVMPSFDKLLTVEERWMLVNYIRTLQP